MSDETKNSSAPEKSDARKALEERAAGLGLKIAPNMKDDTLQKRVDEAEKEAAKTEKASTSGDQQMPAGTFEVLRGCRYKGKTYSIGKLIKPAKESLDELRRLGVIRAAD
ncbi:MAG: hypothetical protein AAF755_10335 [Pseudomonadota bacterium]